MKKIFAQDLLFQLRSIAFPAILFLIGIGFYGCSGCSKSGTSSRYPPLRKPSPEVPADNVPDTSGNIVKMIKQDGVYHIPVSINGVSMYFIFDTGAGYISISSAEAESLYRQGKLTSEDVVGKANLMDANGDVSVGIMIILREVQIGNKVLHDVQATVMGNLNAPLLVGQSALEKFGRISIDYEKGEISFE
jgi:aspartyl protease family protein